MAIELQNNGIISNTVKFVGSGRVIVHKNAQIRDFSVIEMDKGLLEIMDDSVLGYFSMIQCTGNISIGKNSLIGPHCTLLASYHLESNDPSVQVKLVRSCLNIGSNVWSGANVVFNHGISVGDNSIIGACSFVNKDIPPSSIYAGVPAKFIRHK